MHDRLLTWLNSAAAHRLGLAAVALSVVATAAALWLHAAPDSPSGREELLDRVAGWINREHRDDLAEDIAVSRAFLRLCSEVVDAVVAESLTLEAAVQRVHDHCVLHYPNHLRQIKMCYGDHGSSLAEVRIGVLLQIYHGLRLERYHVVPPALVAQFRDIPSHLVP